MNTRRNVYIIVVTFLMASLFLVACERPLQDNGDATITPVTEEEAEVPAETEVAGDNAASEETAAGEEAVAEDEAAAEGDAAAGEDTAAEGDAATTEDAAVAEESSSESDVGTADAAGEGALPGTAYAVVAGDTLFDIAARFGASWVAVAEYNNIGDVNSIQVGEVIYIPPADEAVAAEGEEATSEEVAAGSEEAATEEGATTETDATDATSGEEGAVSEGSAEEAAAETSAEEEPVGQEHTVAEGETLFDIAAQYDISWVVVAELNKIEDVSNLEVGRIILIPVIVEAAAGEDADAAAGDEGEVAVGDEGAPAEGTADTGSDETAGDSSEEAASSEGAADTGSEESEAASSEGDATAEQSSDGGQATASSAAGEIVYIVKPGDTLFRIGLQFGMSWVDIARANGIVNPDLIKAGQQLIIPGSSQPPPSHETTYVVRPGDTLMKIAQQFGVSWQLIAQRNQIAPPYIIYAGQTLIIPGVSS